jgi:acetyl-CoA carboxylase carboxyl transferase subunit beta
MTLTGRLIPVRTIRDILRREQAPEPPETEPAREQCLSCSADLSASKSYERYRVCHSCGFHFHLSARERIATLLDPGSFHEDDRGVTAIDPLSFSGRQSYRSRVINAQRRTGLTESALTGTGNLFGRDIVIAVVDFSFLGGSIGVVAGERLARAFEKATSRRTAVVTVLSTSGTRMQEGLLALMQSARVAAAAQRHAKKGLPHVAIVTDPTTGSAYTGIVNLADFIIAEPNALVGYAALRVLQETEGADLPAHAHTSESHLQHGLVDAVIPRGQLRDSLALLLDLLMNDYRLSAPKEVREGKQPHTQRVAWQQVQLSRHEERPTARDFISRMASSFVEIHGDRMGEDDQAIVAGFALLGGEAVMMVGENRPHEPATTGWITPDGFRKARRAIELAGKFDLPLLTFIDTAGALPSLESEEAGLGYALASCTGAMLDVRVPTIAAIIGEGNSEAALALAVADRVLMLDNAVYEVIRPEDAAKILYQEAGRAGEAAERLRLTSHDCLKLGIVDTTVPEPGEGAHTDHGEASLLLRRALIREITRLQRMREKRRLERRYDRYREVGSTRSWLRGTVERRVAHLTDSLGGAWDRFRDRSLASRRRMDFDEHPDIPV